MAAKIPGALDQPLQLRNLELPVGTSIGIARYQEGMDVGGMIRAADKAMYRAKAAGGRSYRLAPDKEDKSLADTKV